MLNRRGFLAVLGATAFAVPGSLAEQSSRKVPRIGWLVPTTQAEWNGLLEEYRSGMRELGVTASTPACLAAKRATENIPVVFAASSDPISTGVVASLARPGGNVTGLSLMASDLSAKRLELLHTLVPALGRIAVLWDSSNPGMAIRARETRDAAERASVIFFDAGAKDLDSLETMFVQLSKQKPLAVVVTTEPFTQRHRTRILDFMSRNGIPAMYEDVRFVEDGGLMSYGPSVSDLFRRSAIYVDKILKGAKPADLPVEQPTKFPLAINLSAAKALGLSVPDSILVQAEKVIE
jgi:putative tryptophan/tyrosine transport system substrate-binding protein